MRIGFDAKRAFVNQTGLGGYSRFVVEQLSNNYPNNSYFLFSPKFGPFFEPNIENTTTVIGPFKWSFQNSYWRSLQMAPTLSKFNLDIFHGLSNELPFDIDKLSLKKVVTIHDVIFLRFPDQYNRIDRAIYTLKTRKAIALADKIVVPSLQTATDLVDFLGASPNKIEVIHQACNPIFSNKQPTNIFTDLATAFRIEKPYFLLVGRFEKRKNQVGLLNSFAKLPQNEVQLVLVGTFNKIAKMLQNEAKNRNLSVVFIEKVTLNQLAALYQNARAIVYPSLYEGFGIPLVEAFAAGVPVITSNVSCLPEVGGNAPLFVEPQNESELTSVMLEVLNNNLLHEQLSDASKKEHNRFLPKTLISNLVQQVYEPLLGY